MNLNNISYEKIIENLHDALYFVDQNKIITYWNKAAERISGYKASEVVGKSCSDNILCHVDCNGTSLCEDMCPLAASISDKLPRETEVYLHHKNGHRVPVSVRVNPLFDESGKVVGGIELFTDISNKSINELRIKALEKLALTDSLTQLANRHFINREIQNRFEEQKRLDITFGLLFIDIDNFKKVNDTYGHDTGDKILQLLANTIIANARPFDLYGRWGGEEFIGIIRDITSGALESLGNRLRMLIATSSILHENKKLSVTISIGATLVKKNDTLESLMKRADTLLYKSKSAGKNCLTIDI